MSSSKLAKSFFETTSSSFEFSNEAIRDRLDEMARLYPDHVAYIVEHNGDLEVTYAELRKRVECLARHLLVMGFEKGDRLAFQIPNSAETIFIVFACIYIGVVAVPIDMNLNAAELEYFLVLSEPKGLICMPFFGGFPSLEVFKQVCPEIELTKRGELASAKLHNLKHVILLRSFWNLESEGEMDFDWSKFWKFEEIFNTNAELSSTDFPSISPNDDAFVTFTVSIFLIYYQMIHYNSYIL